MCGIAGFTQFNHQFGDEKTLKNMGNSIRHRGPDAEGVYLDRHIGLCHRRLSIIDLSEAGNQPMHSHDGRFVITFNGEIYNYLSLREQLLNEGYPFKTESDTEVVLALYEKHGEHSLEKLNGMFAFALWDKEKNNLFVARDRIGKKPFYYYRIDNDIVFASELKALLTLKQVPRDIRLDALYDYFAYQYIPDPKTIFEDIYKLEPGHHLQINQTQFKKTKYWDISFTNSLQLSQTELISKLRSQIDRSTSCRMISDVPLGAFLSGGVDSSGIVASMAKNSESPITTCTIGFDNEQFNETEFANLVAEQYQTKHHEFTVHQNVRENLKKIVSFFDEPFADPSLVPTFFVSQLARQKVTVAVAGDGGDEVFAGYEKYSIDRIENGLRRIFPQFIRKGIFPIVKKFLSLLNNKYCRKGVTLLDALSQTADMGFYLSNAQITDTTWNRIITTNTQSQLGKYHPSSITAEFYKNSDAPDHLGKILYTDMKTYLPGDILVKVDRMSMANSLEVRAPLLDYQLMEFATSIPSQLKLNRGEKKYILKETFKQDLPNEILYRKKMGFSVPLADWLRTEIKELAESTLFQASSGLPTYFKMQEIRNLWDNHQSHKNDNATLLWSMLMFQLWWNEYMNDMTRTA